MQYRDILNALMYGGSSGSGGSAGGDNYFGPYLMGTLEEVEDTTATSIKQYGLYEQPNLKRAYLPAVTSVGPYAFQKDAKLEEVTLGNVSTLGQYAFDSATSLKKINAVFLVDSVPQYAFRKCPIETINIPVVSDIGVGAFNGSGLSGHIRFDTVKTVRGQALQQTDSALSYDFPVLETFIGSESIHNSKLLTALILRNPNVVTAQSERPLGTWGPIPSATGKGYIYVPSALVENYRTATNWALYSDKFRAIEDYTLDGTIGGEMDWAKMETP